MVMDSKAGTEQQKQTVYIPVKDLRFDFNNPRLPSSIVQKGEEAILKWMLDKASIIELMRSIGKNGYYSEEPLIVVRRKANQETFDVVEGNRRLTAVKLLLDPTLAPVKKNAVQVASDEADHKPAELPVFIYESRDEILKYLGYRHITGINQWDSLAKAKYLEQLRETLPTGDMKDQFEILAKTIGSNRAYVARLLTGLKLYEEIEEADYFNIENLSEQSIDFSLITTALQYSNIVEYLGLRSNDDPTAKAKPSHLKHFVTWIFQRDSENKTKLGESRNLKHLNAVVKNDVALKAFMKGSSLTDAAMLTGFPSEVFRNSITKARAFLHAANEYVYKVEDPSDGDITNLEEIEKLVRYLKTSLKASMEKREDE